MALCTRYFEVYILWLFHDHIMIRFHNPFIISFIKQKANCSLLQVPINIFHFSRHPGDFSVYDISACYEDHSKLHLMVLSMSSFLSNVVSQPALILKLKYCLWHLRLLRGPPQTSPHGTDVSHFKAQILSDKNGMDRGNGHRGDQKSLWTKCSRGKKSKSNFYDVFSWSNYSEN